MGILTGALLASFFGWWYKSKEKIEDFDTILLEEKDPVKAQVKLERLLQKALDSKKWVWYGLIASQVALVKSMQQKFNEAYTTLDRAEVLLANNYVLAEIPLHFERGRVMYQEDLFVHGKVIRFDEIYEKFRKSYLMSLSYKHDYDAINAAHMIAIIVPNHAQKISWNNLAIDLTLQTKDSKAAMWLGPLYNNLGQNYFDAGKYEESLDIYQKALEFFTQNKDVSRLRVAQWTIGRCLRMLGKIDEALVMQYDTVKACNIALSQKRLDMPESLFYLTRGFMYEELAFLSQIKNNHNDLVMYARLALQDLKKDLMFSKTSPERIKKLESLAN
jgi:tetratricopeptide (TPR) repeat protein